MAKRTITLSNRPPVVVDEEKWGIIAQASDSEHDGQVECQANRKSSWSIRVRTPENEDGRALVYAVYNYTSNWQNARDYCVKHGDMLPKGSDTDAIIRSIQNVASRMAGCEHHADDADRWAQLADDCIADMPAEELGE